MNPAPAEAQTWSARRLWWTVGLLMVVQVGLIFWLGARDTGASLLARPPGFTMVLPVDQTAGLAGAADPTVLVLPHPHGFSGASWLRTPSVRYEPPDTTEPPRPLAPRVDAWGRASAGFIETNATDSLELVHHVPPRPDPIEAFSVLNLAPTQSTLRVEGELAGRGLADPAVLRAWAASDLVLTNSAVRVGVDAHGQVFSAMLDTPSGLPEADNWALNFARSVRFQPQRPRLPGQSARPAGRLAWGRLVFQWLTVAPPATNPPPRGL